MTAPGAGASSNLSAWAVLLVNLPLLLKTLSNVSWDILGRGFVPPSTGDIISPNTGTRFGTFSMWSVLVWSLALTILVFLLPKKTYQIIGIVHAAVWGILLISALALARGSVLSSLPLFALQTGVALILWEAFKCKGGE